MFELPILEKILSQQVVDKLATAVDENASALSLGRHLLSDFSPSTRGKMFRDGLVARLREVDLLGYANVGNVDVFSHGLIELIPYMVKEEDGERYIASRKKYLGQAWTGQLSLLEEMGRAPEQKPIAVLGVVLAWVEDAAGFYRVSITKSFIGYPVLDEGDYVIGFREGVIDLVRPDLPETEKGRPICLELLENCKDED